MSFNIAFRSGKTSLFVAGVGFFAALMLFGFTDFARAAITSFTVSAVDAEAGESDADYDFSFSTNNATPRQGITITFPSGYSIQNGIIGGGVDGNVVSINGSNKPVIQVLGSSAARSITITMDNLYALNSGPVSFRIVNGITNPGTPGPTGAFLIDTLPSGESATTTGVVIAWEQSLYMSSPESIVAGMPFDVEVCSSGGGDSFSGPVTLSHSAIGKGFLTGNLTASTSDDGCAHFNLTYVASTTGSGSFMLTASSAGQEPDSDIIDYDVADRNIIVLALTNQDNETAILVAGLLGPSFNPIEIVPGAPVTLALVRHLPGVTTLDAAKAQWGSTAYRFNTDPNAFGSTYFCIGAPAHGVKLESLGNNNYGLVYVITNTPINPTGIRALQLRTYSQTDCNAGAPGSSEWTGGLGPAKYPNALEVVETVAINDPANDDAYEMQMNRHALDNSNVLSVPTTTGVLVNDAPVADIGPRTAYLVDGPGFAQSFTLNPNGSFTYKPQVGVHGTDSFTYSVLYTRTNGQPGTSTPATVNIVIKGTSIDDLSLSNASSTATTTLVEGERYLEDALVIAPGAPVTLNLTLHVTGSSTNQWGSTAYRFNSGPGVGTTAFCIPRTSENTEELSESLYRLTHTITNAPVSPAGPRYFQVRTYASGNCDGATTTPSAWTGKGGPKLYEYAINVVSSPLGGGGVTLIANNDSYTLVATSTGPSLVVSAGDGVLDNDDIPEDVTSAVAALVQAPAHHGGDFNLGSDGSFTYTPQAGHSGTDTFTYRIEWTRTNGMTGTTTVATTTITTVGGVWVKEVKLIRGDSQQVVLRQDGENLHGSNQTYDDTLLVAPGAPLFIQVTAHVVGNPATFWKSLGYRFNRLDNLGNNNGIGDSFSCVTRTMGGYGNTTLNDDGSYTLTYQATNTPISPEGVRNFYLRIFSGNECQSIGDGVVVSNKENAWRGSGGPEIYWQAIDTTNASAPGLVAVNDHGYFVAMGGFLTATVSVLDNDAPASPPRTATRVGSGLTQKGGEVTLNLDGTFTYDPADDFHGIDTFKYLMNYKRINGTSATTSPATVFIVVGTTVNDNHFDFSAYGISTTSATTTVNVPQGVTLSGSSSAGTVVVQIPGNTDFNAATGSWNGSIDLVPVLSSVPVTPAPGTTVSVAAAIEIGLGNTPVVLSKAVKITFLGHAGKLVGWVQNGVFTPITANCAENTQNWANTLPAGGDCKVSNDGSGNLVVWTKHLTTYAVYTQTANPAPSSGAISRSGGGGGGNNVGAATSSAPQATGGLSAAQRQSILDLLRSFGADDATIAKVSLALSGQYTGPAAPAAPSGLAVRDLQYGDEGADVVALQQLLMAQGYSIPAGATSYFLAQTQTALAAYQAAHGITPAAGYFGAKTRAQMKAAGLQGLWW